MIELSGLKPDEDIKIEFVGMRPGEKLFEEISHRGESFVPTAHSKILRFISSPVDLGQMQKILNHLRASLYQFEPDQLKLLLKEAVPEYQAHLSDKAAGTNGVKTRALETKLQLAH
jgi:FlaA1/EpsC-like NDP-sugar epimerase